MRWPSSQRGAALIVVLLLAAIVAAVAGARLEEQDFAVRRLENEQDFVQARWVLKGGVNWARSVLSEDARLSSIDHRKELWATGLLPTQIEQGTVAGEIVDYQGLFNLANLFRDGKPSERDLAHFRRLLSILALRPELADAIVAQPGILEVGDLYKARGVEGAAIAKLKPFVAVLPRRTPLNVNTAPPEVLAAVIDALTLGDAQVLAKSLAAAPIPNAQDLAIRLPRPDLLDPREIGTASEFFLVRGRAEVGKADLRMEALLERHGKAWPSILWERVL